MTRGQGSIFEAEPQGDAVPLAARMRPRTLDEVIGQDSLVGPGGTIRRLFDQGRLQSLILWGPPGSGKTTIARLIADRVDAAFVPFSAIADGVPRLREIVREARERQALGRRTILFLDEIHRLNKTQQSALLPDVESGLLTLVGATTENPSFEVISPLLSRARVMVLEPLTEAAIGTLVERAVGDTERGLGARNLTLAPGTALTIARLSGGDARDALGILELTAALASKDAPLDDDAVAQAVQRRVARHDKSGESHFNLLSAFHKSLRGSDPQASLYYAARLLEGGEDPLVIFRRLICAAYEDVGLADPQAAIVAVTAMNAFERLGLPEGRLALANAVVYVATALKSNHAYVAFEAARASASESSSEPIPLRIRNAPTRLMKDLGYHTGYEYAHDWPGAIVPMEHLPDSLVGTVFYTPTDRGVERRIAERMDWADGLRRAAKSDTSTGDS